MKILKKHNRFSAVRMLRTMEGLTIGALAEKVGLQFADIIRIEHGRNCLVDRYQRLAVYFGVSIEALIRNDISAIAKTRKMPVTQKLSLQEKMKKYNAECSRIGDKGQQLAYQWEIERLEAMGSELVYLVNPNCADDRNLGFDMLSFDAFNNPIFVEVKATKNAPEAPFKVSQPELSKAHECLELGIIYQVHRIGYVDDPEKRTLTVISAQEFVDNYDFKPTEYLATKKGACAYERI